MTRNFCDFCGRQTIGEAYDQHIEPCGKEWSGYRDGCTGSFQPNIILDVNWRAKKFKNSAETPHVCPTCKARLLRALANRIDQEPIRSPVEVGK